MIYSADYDAEVYVWLAIMMTVMLRVFMTGDVRRRPSFSDWFHFTLAVTPVSYGVPVSYGSPVSYESPVSYGS